MNAFRTTAIAAVALFAIGSGVAFAGTVQPTGNGTAFTVGGPAATSASTGSGDNFASSAAAAPGGVNANEATGAVAAPASGVARADTCFVEQPVYNRAGKAIGHHTVDICAQ